MKDTLLRYYWLLLLGLLALRPDQASAQTAESFESGTKATYSTGTVTLVTGDWDFTDALLGTNPADHKNGSQAVRIEQQGRLTMDFFLPGGASLVTVQHAAYGADASSAWELWAQSQSCSCNNWTKIGATVLTTSNSLQTAVFSVNLPGSVRFEIRKVAGGAARLNLDDFTVTGYGSIPTYTYGDNDNMALGNPSGAMPDEFNYENNYLMRKYQYAVSYNRADAKPNWVSWHLDISNRGTSDRQNDFRPDSLLPASWYHVLATDYVGSGFDRGHNCPSADRTATVADNSATFLMSNMMPQAPNNNQQTWGNLEDYCRKLVSQGNELYIICGSYGRGGTGSAGYQTTIASGKITVPSNCWKVVVVLADGNNDVSRVASSTRIIAINTPNDNGLNSAWGGYRTTVDAIETAAGLDLLSALPVGVQNAVEARPDTGPTN